MSRPSLLAPPEQLLSGWGRTAPTRTRLHAPSGAGELADMIAGAGPRGVLARGGGRSYGDAATCAGGDVISTRALAGIEWVEDGAIRVGGGVMLATLLEQVVPRGWFLPVTPGTRYVTVGGAIAADVHGKNHLAAGSFGAHVRSIELVLADGERVTARAGDDVFRVTCGGMGLTGVIVGATLELDAIETSDMWVENTVVRDIEEALRLMATPSHEHLVAWVDAASRSGRSVITTGRHATGEGPLEPPPASARSLPRWLPGGLLSAPAVRAFNEAKFRLATCRPAPSRQRLEGFFYALDAIGEWNRLYGPLGLVQYQFAVPLGGERVITSALSMIARDRCPCPLAVLKRLGRGTGLLSFAIEGWTLALDFPARARGLGALLSVLDELVASAGGRVYLAKDGRLRPELLPRMYPQLDEWRELRAGLDPHGRFGSDLSRRLGLVSAP